AALGKMRVVGDGAIGMLDEDIIGIIHIAAVATAFVRVVLDFNDTPFASGVDGRSSGHLEVDGVLIRAGVAVRSVVALGHAVGRAGFKWERVNVGVVVFSQSAADGVMAGVAKAPVFA